ncbi:hypothetical protein X986_5127 [Burkholderia pseudomallei]|nr:hypothetical protein DO73_631 [Burkholderia pseudomallei]KGD10766.1 hypothetical protein DP42_593 [Burkholderia pseudomallei]KGV62321.1 hypothetical protein X898_2829 [Burkholderia pseudomallei ABCPW 91]KGX21439.1 hypothetical protein X984_2366 [Burkholderia pseudomallei]KGX25483.1 hypothetical protein X986_5127 [Burkholderia pseudomallei]
MSLLSEATRPELKTLCDGPNIPIPRIRYQYNLPVIVPDQRFPSTVNVGPYFMVK